MPKVPVNTTDIDNSLTEAQDTSVNIKKLAELTFSPNAAQRKIKVKFWARFKPGPFADRDYISIGIAKEITKCARIDSWWKLDGFVEWFTNKDAVKERISYLFEKSLDTAEEILDNPDAAHSAKTVIIKMLAELNGNLTKQKDIKFADEQINQMSAKQLEKLIAEHMGNATVVKQINIPPENNNNNDGKKAKKAKTPDGPRPDFPG